MYTFALDRWVDEPHNRKLIATQHITYRYLPAETDEAKDIKGDACGSMMGKLKCR